jgi:hypothetical protein
LVALSATAGCKLLDELIEVNAPDRIQAESLEQPGNALTLLAGAIGDFECAFGQAVVFGGTFTEELQWSLGVESWRPIDARELTSSGFNSPHSFSTCDALFQGDTPGLYKVMSIARWQADHLLDLLDQWAGEDIADREMIEARAAAYSGYGHVILGEMMCSAAFDLGPELQPDEIFDRAVDRFTVAIGVASAIPNDTIVNLARVGRARALQNLGDLAGAKADAQLVPAGFLVEAEYSSVSLRRENSVYAFNNRRNTASVEAPFRSIADPRVPVRNENRLSGRGIPMFVQTKYPAPSSPIPLATWEEAQLIVAEAELDAGNLQAAVDAINRVRTRPGVGLPPFASTVANAIRDQLLSERKVELFLESHRMGDMRRYDLPLTPPPGATYPIGGTYGDQRCAPLSRDEEVNNPNIRVAR